MSRKRIVALKRLHDLPFSGEGLDDGFSPYTDDELFAIVRPWAEGDRWLRQTMPQLYTPEIIYRTGWRPRALTCQAALQAEYGCRNLAQIRRVIRRAFEPHQFV